MKQKKVQASFQLQDSYVREFNIKTIKKINEQSNLTITGELGFKIISITEGKDNFIGEIELVNDIKTVYKEEECTNIHISMIGIFAKNKENEEENDMKAFEQMLKINGATTLSHLIRAYIYTITGLSGTSQISTPMINFVEFFKNAEKNTEDNYKN